MQNFSAPASSTAQPSQTTVQSLAGQSMQEEEAMVDALKDAYPEPASRPDHVLLT